MLPRRCKHYRFEHSNVLGMLYWMKSSETFANAMSVSDAFCVGMQNLTQRPNDQWGPQHTAPAIAPFRRLPDHPRRSFLELCC